MCQRGCRARDAPAGLPLLTRACAPRGQDTSGSAACDRFGAVLPCHEDNLLFAHRRSFCGSHPQDHSVEQGIHGAVKRTEGCCSSAEQRLSARGTCSCAGNVHCQGDAGPLVWGRCYAGSDPEQHFQALCWPSPAAQHVPALRREPSSLVLTPAIDPISLPSLSGIPGAEQSLCLQAAGIWARPQVSAWGQRRQLKRGLQAGLGGHL